MILALTGAGISQSSGIPTFAEQPGIRDSLTRGFANSHPQKYLRVIRQMQAACDVASPNDAHLALAEYDIPVITMNIDTLHQQAGSKHVLAVHGTLPDIVLYDDPAPLYVEAHNWIAKLREGDCFLIIGTSFYTNISVHLKIAALGQGADVVELNDHAETKLRPLLEQKIQAPQSADEFFARERVFQPPPLKLPYG